MSNLFENPAFLASLGGSGVGETDPSSPQNHYAFADTANIHVDEEAHTNLGTNGSPTVSSGVAVFDSPSNYLDATNIVTGAFTVTCKARLEGTFSNPRSFTIWSLSETTEHIGLNLRTGDSGEFHVWMDSFDDDENSLRFINLSEGITLAKSTLAFVGLSFSPDSEIIWQINDQQGLISDFIPNTTGAWTTFLLGTGSYGSGDSGRVDDLRTWDRALTPDELNYVYTNL